MPKPRSSCRSSRPRSPTTPKPGWCRARCSCRTTRTPLPKPRSSAMSSWRRPSAQARNAAAAWPRPTCRCRGSPKSARTTPWPAPGWTRSRIRRIWWPRRHRRASILARQGKMDEARKLLRALPDRAPADARAKLLAEVQLLREHKQYKAAYDLLAQAAAKPPFDADLRLRPGDAGGEDGQPAGDGAPAAPGDRRQARLPPCLQRAGLFARRTQSCACRKPRSSSRRR